MNKERQLYQILIGVIAFSLYVDEKTGLEILLIG